MTVRVGVNGFGRIGRNFWRAANAQKQAGTADIEIVGVNDITDNKTLAHLLQYDSILGRLPHRVEATDEDIVVGEGRQIVFVDPDELPRLDLAESAAWFVPRFLQSRTYRRIREGVA